VGGAEAKVTVRFLSNSRCITSFPALGPGCAPDGSLADDLLDAPHSSCSTPDPPHCNVLAQLCRIVSRRAAQSRVAEGADGTVGYIIVLARKLKSLIAEELSRSLDARLMTGSSLNTPKADKRGEFDALIDAELAAKERRTTLHWRSRL